jgi:hypothetical protein
LGSGRQWFAGLRKRELQDRLRANEDAVEIKFVVPNKIDMHELNSANKRVLNVTPLIF